MKQAAVEWLVEQLTKQPIHDITDEHWFGIIGEAKEMEKEQIKRAYDEPCVSRNPTTTKHLKPKKQ